MTACISPALERRDTAGRSPAGSANAQEPPMVPILRTGGLAILPAASLSTSWPSRRSVSSAVSRWRRMAPIVTVPSDLRTASWRPATSRRETSRSGATRSAFIMATRVAPPARQAAFSAWRAATAASMLSGLTNSMTVYPPLTVSLSRASRLPANSAARDCAFFFITPKPNLASRPVTVMSAS